MSNDHIGLVAIHTNPYGEKKELRKTRWGWRMKQPHSTVLHELRKAIAVPLGNNIRTARQNADLTMSQLGARTGMGYRKPKHRIYEIEKGSQNQQYGITIGMLYALAAVLNVEPGSLLPSLDSVFEKASVKFESTSGLAFDEDQARTERIESLRATISEIEAKITTEQLSKREVD